MTQNPNWPLIDVAVSFDSGPTSAMPAPHWCSVKARTRGQIGTTRGRQYELDQVQTGTWTGSLQNKDAALDPANTGSPFYPNVKPYRSFRHRAQYPPTVNILTADQATAGKTSGLALGVLPAWVSIVSAGAMTLTTATFSGASNEYFLAYGASNTVGAGVALTGFSVVPGSAHSASASLFASANNGLQMQLSFQWINSAGGVISTTSGTAGVVTTSPAGLSVSGTAPSNAVGAVLRVLSSNSVALATNIAVLQLQVEYNASPTTYVTPNTWYSLFTGYVERWPQSWTMNGQFSQSNLTVVDAFGYLSQQKLLSPVYQELLVLSPTFVYPLDESTPTVPGTKPAFYDLTGNRKPASLLAAISAASADATVVPGDSLAATGGYLPQGLGGPVAGLYINTVPSVIEGQPIDLSASGSNPVGPLSSTNFTRVYAFRTPKVATTFNMSSLLLFQFSGPPSASGGNGMFLQLTYEADGTVDTPWLFVSNGGSVAATLRTNPNNLVVSDGGWHIIILGVSGTTLFGWFDNVAMTSSGPLPATTLNGGALDEIGVPGGGTATTTGLVAEFSLAAELPFAVSSAQASALYSAFRYGGSGLGSASSATRYQDILRWGSWAGLQSVDNFTTGETVAYGPATEMNAPASSSGTDVLSMLQTVVDTEAGFHYVAADGTITFKARRARYNQSTPAVTFGENTAGGEVPYTTVATGYDPTRIANDVSVTQTQTSATQRALDLNSASQYGDITLSRTANTLNPLEQSDAAQYLLLRNSQPVQRVEGISVNVGANPTLWTTMLSLELGVRVRMMRRPPLGAATIQVDGFVEQLNWTFDDKGNASVEMQISVNNQQQYWQLDSATFSVLGTTTVIGY